MKSVRIVVSVLMAMAGAYLISRNGIPKVNETVNAADSYSATWTATKLMTVESYGGWATVPAQTVPIGVAAWQVEGVSGNTALYSETWSVPDVGDIVFTPSTEETTGTRFVKSEWLFVDHIGVLSGTPSGGAVTYRIKDVSDVLTPAALNYKYQSGSARVGGNAIHCVTADESHCLHARGAYGWEVYHALSNLGSERGRISASGLMMPLVWKVSGTIY